MVNKNLGKFVTGAATAAMVATAIVPVVGAEEINEIKDIKLSFSDVSESNTHAEGIEYVKDRGITVGYEDGTFRPGDSIKRVHAALMIARAFDADPNGNYPDSGFTDVPESYKWAVDFLVSQGIVSGKSPTYFGSQDSTSRAQMAKIITNTYNLQLNDENTFEFTDVSSHFEPFVKALSDNGITFGITPTQYGSNSDVTRGQFASFIHRVETTDLVQELNVEKVVNDNSREIKVEFNNNLLSESVTDKSNIVIKVAGEVVKDYTIEFKGEKELLVLLSDEDKIKHNSAVSIEINGNIKSELGGKGLVEDYSKTWVFQDEKAPELLKTEIIGTDIVVTFNEYVSNVETFKINGKTINSPETLKESTKTLIFKDAGLNLVPGTHDLLLSGVTDILENKSGVLTSELVVKADVTAPAVTSIVQKDNHSFEIVFDKSVSLVGSDAIEVKKNGFTLKSEVTKVESDRKFTVTLTDVDPLNVYATGEDSSVVDVVLKGFKSKVNNELGAKHEYKLTLVKDKVAPEIVSDKVGIVNKGTADEVNEVLEIVFDEDIVLVGNKDNIVVLDKDGIKQTVSDVEVFTNSDGDKNSLRIEVSSIKNSSGKINAGTYSVELPTKFVKDKYDNEIGKTSVTVTKKAETETVGASATSEANVITVVYDTEMGASALDKGNYTFDGKELGSDSKVYFSGDKKTVTIELADETVKVSGSGILSISDKVLNDYGVAVTKADRTITIASGFIDNVKPVLLSAKKLSINTIELTFSETIDDTTLADNAADDDFIVKINGVSFAYAVTTGTADDNKVILTTVDTFNLSNTLSVEVTDILANIDITDTSDIANKLTKSTLVTAN